MVWQRVSPIASSSFQAMADFTLPSASFSIPSQTPANRHCLVSFDGSSGRSDADDCALTPASGGADLASSTWPPQVPPCPLGSTVSRCPSLNDSECIATPPYLDQPSMYHSMSQPEPQAPNFMSSNIPYIDDSQHNWARHFTEAEASALPASVRMCYECDYGGQSAPSVGHYAQPYQSNTSPPFQQSLMGCFKVGQPSESAQFSTQGQGSSAGNSSGSGHGTDAECSNSEDEEDDFSFSSRKTSRSSSASNHKTSPKISVMNLGKWSKSSRHQITHSEHRDFVCPLFEQRDANGKLCEKRFSRPEHLRRHVNTVHGTDRLHVCLVPHCNRPFSRGDNLQEHYWTHVERGGRAGKNYKMSLEGLKIILGPDETKLAKKLKWRLINYKREQKLNRQKKQLRAKL